MVNPGPAVTSAKAFLSLGQLRYLSCILHVDAVVGNSSSGLIEAPSFKKGTINIGSRQHGRLKAKSVINCEPNRESIAAAITKLYSPEFKNIISDTLNPYGDATASEKIVKILRKHSLDNLVKKSFYDLTINNSIERN